jgi:hypothetical protein
VNLTRRFGGDEDKRKGNYAERTKLQRAVIYIVPIMKSMPIEVRNIYYSP